jgi:hypothetical protein
MDIRIFADFNAVKAVRIWILRQTRDKVPARDVNLIFSFFHLYSVISKLMDKPVWYLFKNDGFTLQVFGHRIQNKKFNIKTVIGLKRKHQNETIRLAFCFCFDFIQPLFFDKFPGHKRQSIQVLCKNVLYLNQFRKLFVSDLSDIAK